MKIILMKVLFSLLRIGAVAIALSLMENNAQTIMTVVVALAWGITTIVECYLRP